MNYAIEKLAAVGIEVNSDGKLQQDRSVQLYEDGHLYDYGRGGVHYTSAEEFITERLDLHDAPVQVNKTVNISAPKYDVVKIYNAYAHQFKELEKKFKVQAMYEVLPEAYWTRTPNYIGYSFKDKSITISVLDNEVPQAVTIRSSGDIKWKTFGKKSFIPTRLTGKDEVYIASGMGEILLMDLMGYDYIGLQSDSVIHHLSSLELGSLDTLIILPDNDTSFTSKIDKIIELTNPRKSVLVKYEDDDVRDLATRLNNPAALQEYIDNNQDVLHEYETLKQIEAEERAEAKARKEKKILTIKNKSKNFTPHSEYTPIQGYEVYSLPILDVKLHEIADEHPLHDEVSRNALKADLDMNGQLTPVIIYRGKIVDGRHRYWLLLELGVDNILATKLPDSYTLEDVRSVVFSSEIRRHQTPTQKAIQAYLYSLKHGLSQSKSAKKFGASKQMVSKAVFVDKHKGKQDVYDLYHGKKVIIGTRSTDSLSVYVNLIEDELEEKRKANCKITRLSNDDVRITAAPYIDALKKEHVDVVSYIARQAYRLAEEM